MSYNDRFPPIETVLGMAPEELAPIVLADLKRVQKPNRYNYTLGSDPELNEYAGAHKAAFLERLMEAWMWLEREGFIAPKPGSTGEWYFVTRRGEQIVDAQDFQAYRRGHLLPSENLDPIIVQRVRPLFLTGDYDTAVFRAFKEVEIRVRAKGGFANKDIGVPLMRKAFQPGTGPLADKSADAAEQEAVANLFAGAIGKYKNPSSHRDVSFDDPQEAAELVHMANHLLRLVDRTSDPTR